MGPIPADAQQTFTGTLEAINSAAPHPGSIFARLPTGFTVWYIVTGTGILDGEWEPHPSSVVFGSTAQNLTVTGAFEGIECKGYVRINGSGFRGGCTGSDSTRLVSVDTFKLRDSVFVTRLQGPTAATYQAFSPNESWRCTKPYCRVYTGKQELTFTRINGEATLRATKYGSTTEPLPASVRWGTFGHFYPGRTPDVLPFSVRGWTWTADPSSIAPKTTDCSWSAEPCTPTFKESGTMKVTAYVNGRVQEKTHRVEVIRRKLQLSPAAAYVQVGDTVRWTATIDTAGGTSTGWKWAVQGDTVGLFKATTCKPVYPFPVACYDVPTRSYTRVLEAIVDDSLQRREAEVRCDSCRLTGDPALDDGAVRQTLMELMRKSNPDSAPGSGIVPSDPIRTGHRKERAAWIYRRGDGTYYTIQVTGSAATECSISIPAPPFPEPGASFVGTVHTHPSKPGDKVFGQCSVTDSKGQQLRAPRYPGETGPGIDPDMTAGNDHTNGGGSPNDWAAAVALTQTVYVMNAAGEIWRLPGFPNTGPVLPNTNNRFTWKSSNPLDCEWW